MAITTQDLGPSSWMLTFGMNENNEDVIQAIEDVITTQGWEFHSTGGDAFGSRVYKAPMFDNDEIFKYVRITFSALAFTHLRLEVYEDWTTTGINLAYDSNNTSTGMTTAQKSTGFTLFVFCSPQYLGIWGRSNDGTFDAKGPIFCAEITKDNEQEITGEFPRFAWFSATHFHGGNNTTSYLQCFSLPRSIANTTGASAYYYNTVSTLFGRTVNVTAQRLSNQMPSGIFNPLDKINNSIYALTPYAVDVTTTHAHVRGRFYGLKVLTNSMGANMDIASIKVDENGFYSETGTDTDHHIITQGTARLAIPI